MADQQTPKTFDFESFARDELGGRVVGHGETPGTVKIEVIGEDENGAIGPQVKEFDLSSFAKDELKVDPATLPVKYNSPETAVSDSPLGFIDRIRYETARKIPDQARLLKEKFKPEEIRFNPETKTLSVNDKGIWKNAGSTGMTGFFGGEGDVIAGAVVGGAAATAAAAPYAAALTFGSGGTLTPVAAGVMVGAGAIGSGIGAMVARFGTMKMAESAGLRTEQDAQETMKELGKEGILALSGELIGPIVKLGAKGTAKVMNNSVKRISKMMGVGSELETAQTMSAMTGLETLDNQIWLAHTDDVETQQLRSIDWEANRLKPNAPQMNPVRKEMADKVQEAVEVVHKKMDDDFVAMDNKFKPIVEKAKVNMESEHQMMIELGKDLNADISTFADPASKRQLTRVMNLMRRAIVDESSPEALKKELTGTETRTIIRNLGDLIKNNFNKGPDEISTRAVAKIQQLRNGLSEKLVSSIDQVDPGIGSQYKKMNADYSQARSWVDDFAKRTKNERVDKTVVSLFEPGGGRDLQSMSDALQAAGKDSQEFLNYVRVRRAGSNSTELYKSPSINYTPGGTVVKGATGGSLLRDSVGGLLGLTSPKNATPMYAKTFNKIQGVAHMNNFVSKLNPTQRRELLQNPDMLRAVKQITAQAIQGANNGADALVQHALESSQPSPTQFPVDEKDK